MKVLLFVQSGDARPKCVHPNVPEHLHRRSGEVVRDVFHDPHKLGAGRLRFARGRWASELVVADRWWLVECENADDGRRCIQWALASHGFVSSVVQSSEQSPARILASGGPRLPR